MEKLTFANHMQEEIARRIVKFVNRQEKRQSSIGISAIEDVVDALHNHRWRFGKVWRSIETAAEVNGIRKAKRRAMRDATYSTELLRAKDCTIQYLKNGTIEAGASSQPLQSPTSAPETTPLSKRQVRYCLAHIRRQGALPAIYLKRLKASGVDETTIQRTIQEIRNYGK